MAVVWLAQGCLSFPVLTLNLTCHTWHVTPCMSHMTSSHIWCMCVQGYDVLEDMMSPRTSASNFVTTIATKRAKNHMQGLMARVVEVMNTYAAAGGG